MLTKNAQKLVTFWPMIVIFSRLLEVVKMRVHAKFNQGISAAVHELSCSQRKTRNLS